MIQNVIVNASLIFPREKQNYKGVLDNIASFDIETSSYYIYNGVIYDNDSAKKAGVSDKAQKASNMYIWQFMLDNYIFMGRSWEQFIYFLTELKKKFSLNENKILVVYVHNLSYEFQFICKELNFINVFADSLRKPVKALCDKYIEFRCSYRLSGFNLETVAKNLLTHKIEKLNGYLDYKTIRNRHTKLTNVELQYCINDVIIVCYFIEEQLEEYKHIYKIPLTQTGKIRRMVKSNVHKNKKALYKIRGMTLAKLEYTMLKNSFMGGFTHSNAMYNNQKLDNVTSLDFTSSYPYVMLSEKYPMSKGRPFLIENYEQFENLTKKNCVVSIVKYTNIHNSFIYDGIISRSKCLEIQDYKVNNGRVMSAKTLTIVLTDIDIKNIKLFYNYDSIEFVKSYIYQKEYLPKEIIEIILRLYNDKTKLKGVIGKEQEYLHSKELLNSLYGMTVTNIVRDNIIFNNGVWCEGGFNIDKSLEDYNNDNKRFLSYAWGVFVTAYARNNLWGALLECQSDYIYSDTDSIKILNYEKHKDFFNKYNESVINKLKESSNNNNFDFNLIKPKTVKGIEKIIGVWDYEGMYKHFKTLGAKRYIYTDDKDKVHVTIAGLSKKKAEKLFNSMKDCYNFFMDGMEIDKEYSGRLTHTYIDDCLEYDLIDNQGNKEHIINKSCVHLEESSYIMNIALEYLNYIISIRGF